MMRMKEVSHSICFFFPLYACVFVVYGFCAYLCVCVCLFICLHDRVRIVVGMHVSVISLSHCLHVILPVHTPYHPCSGIGWVRTGHSICYYPNTRRRNIHSFYSSLTFSVTMDHTDDTVYFAYHYPYTYTDLCAYIRTVENNSTRRKYMRRRSLCKTLAGTRIVCVYVCMRICMCSI